MKKILLDSFLLLVFFSFIQTNAFSQTSGSDEKPAEDYVYDAKLLLHYTVDELNDLRIHHPDDYNLILYYHLQSYELVITDPSNPSLPLFNLEEFDITKYEVKRTLSDYVEINFDKYGVQLIITPLDELKSLTPLQEIMKNELEN